LLKISRFAKPFGMKPHTTTTITIMAILAAMAGAITASARPTDFSEVSLWVRARETDQSIVREVGHRKLLHALTPQEEATLKAQGASDSLVQSLRGARMIATPAEVAASEAKSQPARTSHSQETAPESPADNLRIFDVPAGQSINLSQWGGPDSEFVFQVFRCAGEDIVDPIMVDTVGTYTDIATYSGPGFRTGERRFRNRRFTRYPKVDLQDSYYTVDTIGALASAVSHETSRGMSIDRQNPVLIKDVPYVLYPVYGVRGISLYYIGHTSDSVKLAVDTSGS
jgi:hypothetical protein